MEKIKTIALAIFVFAGFPASSYGLFKLAFYLKGIYGLFDLSWIGVALIGGIVLAFTIYLYHEAIEYKKEDIKRFFKRGYDNLS